MSELKNTFDRILENVSTEIKKLDESTFLPKTEKQVGKLTDDEVQKLEDVIRNPAKYKCPAWMMNRRKDYETGQDMHLVTTDLDVTNDNDIIVIISKKITPSLLYSPYACVHLLPSKFYGYG